MTLLDRHLGVEALSAALDGGTDPVAVAHLEACPTCRERLATWAAVVGSLRSTAAGSLDAGRADRIVAAALASVPAELASVPPAPAELASVLPAPAAADRPERARRGVPAPWRGLLVTAGAGVAAVGLVALAVVGLRHLGPGSSASSSAAPAGQPAPGGHTAASAAGGSVSAGRASAGPERSASPAAASPAAALRPAADARDLRLELRSRLGSGPGAGSLRVTGGSSGTAVGSGVLAACLPAASRRSAPGAGRPVLAATVRLAGEPAEVYVYPDGHTWEAQVLSRPCAPLTELRF